MKRSVYSLVLMDDVVKAIDQMAYEQNTSRSNLINQLLAQEVMLITPEVRMRDVFDKMMRAMEDDKKFQINLQPSDYCISIRSVLSYKYNPTIRYFIELYRTVDTAIGELKITSRSQSSDLQQYLYDFFKLFSAMEQVYMTKYFPQRPVPYFTNEGEGRFRRELIIVDVDLTFTTDTMALAMGDYVQMLDGLLGIYLTNLNDVDVGARKIEAMYTKFLNDDPILI
ncbi:MAG TPA: hypothetical protein GX707_14675 [Epulopiscium sp.]|nr:hypothetical protein [Candidatus Epulonipiscium sp.]